MIGDDKVNKIREYCATHFNTARYSVKQYLSIVDVIDFIDSLQEPETVCKWTCDRNGFDDSNVYDTGCGDAIVYYEGTPEENNYKYCPFCGKKIQRSE
jgi:hypothetical protein